MNIINQRITLQKIEDIRVDKHLPSYVEVGERVTGIAHMNPQEGERFSLYGDMGIDTSPVTHIDDARMQITTRNSIYQITIT